MRISVLSALALGAGLAIGLSVMRKKQQAALATADTPTMETPPSPDLEKPAPTRAPRARKAPPSALEAADFYATTN
jgi:hypothetical protein